MNCELVILTFYILLGREQHQQCGSQGTGARSGFSNSKDLIDIVRELDWAVEPSCVTHLFPPRSEAIELHDESSALHNNFSALDCLRTQVRGVSHKIIYLSCLQNTNLSRNEGPRRRWEDNERHSWMDVEDQVAFVHHLMRDSRSQRLVINCRGCNGFCF